MESERAVVGLVSSFREDVENERAVVGSSEKLWRMSGLAQSVVLEKPWRMSGLL